MESQLTIALAGNPNSGKTTAFNALTGSHQHVGNYPGITVEKKEGFIKMPSGRCVRFIDLPGTYSLTAYTQEETVARHVLAQERPDVVIDVLNAGALERNLYLTIQLLELGVPVVLALNMMDEAAKQALTSKISFTTDLAKIADAGLVVEAIVENLKVKKTVFQELDAICKPEIPAYSVWLILRGCEFRVFVRNPDEFSCMGRNKAAAIPGKI